MEVHQHAHTERKKWHHYFWEFLMLFLAVFLGFLAENQREHIIEQRRAKQYAKSLLDDLQNDTADIKKAFYFEKLANLMIDSLIDIEHENDISKKGGAIYYYVRMASWQYTIDWNKATINQLINSGNLRYFHDPQLITKISEYNTLSSSIIDLQNTIDASVTRSATYKDLFTNAQYYRLFTRISMDDLYDGKNLEFIDSVKHAPIPIFKNDPALLNQHANALLAARSNRAFLLKVSFPKAIKQAAGIMELLKKEYHLK